MTKPLYAFIILTFLNLFFVHICVANNGKGPVPIHIKSDKMEALDKKGKVIFTGNVTATRGDIVIKADRLEVFYRVSEKDKKGASSKRFVTKLVATGHVKIAEGKRTGTAEKAVYDKVNNRIILLGNAQVWEGPNRISGAKITLFENEQKSVVEGGPGDKVEAVVFPED